MQRTTLNKKKKLSSVEKDNFSVDTIEIDDKMIKHEAFLGCNVVKILFARGDECIFYVLHQIYFPYTLKPNKKLKQQRMCVNIFMKTFGIKRI